MFSFVQTSSKTQSCNTDGIPYVFQYDDTVDAGTDTATANINPFVDGGVEIPSPLRNLSVVADGCDDLIMRVEYMNTGNDCDPCTDPDAVTLEYIYYYIDACEVRSFNNGLYVDVDFSRVPKASRTGNPEADWALASATSQNMRLRVYGDRATNNCCSLPEVTNTRGVLIGGGPAAVPPAAVDDVVLFSTFAGISSIVDVASNDTPCAAPAVTTYQPVSQSNVVVVSNNDGTFTCTPAAAGAWSFVYEIYCDGIASGQVATVSGTADELPQN